MQDLEKVYAFKRIIKPQRLMVLMVFEIPLKVSNILILSTFALSLPENNP